MDEARRFARYVSPGLLYAAEATVLLLGFQPRWTLDGLQQLRSDSGLGLLLGTLLAVTGLGFAFSILHHALHWSRCSSAVNHRPTLAALEEAGVLEIKSATGVPVQAASLNREQAWIIVTALWHQRVESSARIKAANQRATNLIDTVHSLGTARVSSLFALATALVLAKFAAPTGPQLVRLALWSCAGIGFSALVWGAYRRSADFAEQVIDEVLADALTEEACREGRPVVTRAGAGMEPSVRRRRFTVPLPKRLRQTLRRAGEPSRDG